ncbi:MAG: ADP-ribosylglycohydrolase family protein [Lachnospiraceae bacterium]|nr:ADP-ribosylglycohydrolase family protein [Lachnospiraceae bacterium]
MKNIWVNGMMGVVVGDVLGMPVQFVDRAELNNKPVKTIQGYGTYNMPPGTWSDDSSMALATLDSIREKGEVNYSDIMGKFVEWMCFGKYTPAGKAFDQGNTCVEAICKYIGEKDYKTCGKTGEWANGNGALMRIMPACLYAYEKVCNKEWDLKQAMECVHQVSALTHNHRRSKMACGIYYFMVKNIIEGCASLPERLQSGVDDAVDFYHEDIGNYVELACYTRLFQLDEFAKCSEDEIKSSGYVVDSLEAAIWSLITTDTLEEGLLRAVNLGGDTDTIGAIAGGLAVLYYGYDNVPIEWRKQIIKETEIISLCEVMEERFAKNS